MGAPAEPTPLRVCSYNIRYAGLDEGRVAWPKRRDGVAGALRLYRPDAVALQECWLEQLPDLRARLPAYEWVAHPDRNGEHTPIGYRPDRLEHVDSGAFGLAPGGERAVPAWDADIPRQVTHARLRDRESGEPFTLFSVHLDHRGERARTEGAKLLRERLPDGRVLLAGDYNCSTADPPYRTLTAVLDDARAEATHVLGPEETYVGFDGAGFGEDEPTARRLDYVLLRGFEVDAYAVGPAVDDDWHYPSDHLPVVVDLRSV